MRRHKRFECRPGEAGRRPSLLTVIRAYQKNNRRDSVEELTFFQEMPSLELAIHHAALAINPRDKRFDHQRRIPWRALCAAKSLLLHRAQRLEKSRTFGELHTHVRDVCANVDGLGELYAYDTALRLGAFLGLAPQHVYLHAGTKVGAKALGLDTSAGILAPEQLPEPLQSLLPHEIEDILCIYKDRLDQ